jgi:hypothetical protein
VSQSVYYRDGIDSDARMRQQKCDGHEVVRAGVGVDKNRRELRAGYKESEKKRSDRT